MISKLRLFAHLLAFLGLVYVGRAQSSSGPSEVVRVGPGVTPPRVLKHREPEYSPLARADKIQGNVVLQIIVNEKGRVEAPTLISPLGYGLDEQALAAVSKWEFIPGQKDGRPVKILAIVETRFRFPEIWFDEKIEKQRTEFNIALRTLKRPDSSAKAVEEAVKTMRDLAGKNHAPAMFVVGMWQIKGERLPPNPGEGLALLQKAAARNYGPALYEVGSRRIEGQGLPKDVQRGLEEMRSAAVLGSAEAQYFLGSRYERGEGVPMELDRARRYYNLCAARQVAVCQYKLAKLLFDEDNRPERDYLRAVALFQLAATKGVLDAAELASRETAQLTQDQTRWVNELKAKMAAQ